MLKVQSKLTTMLNDHMAKLISKIWVVLSLNYIFCDVLTSMDASMLRMMLAGNIEGIPVTQGFLLIAGLSLEIPFLMLFLANILPYKANRITNMAASSLMILYQVGSLFIGNIALHYAFFSAIEILGNLAIFVLAFRWKQAA